MLREVPKKASSVMLIYIFNASIRLQNFPQIWKLAKVILDPKEGTPLEDPASYQPISLHPTISKPIEKRLHKRFLSVIGHHTKPPIRLLWEVLNGGAGTQGRYAIMLSCFSGCETCI
jgi:hypothetical protein